MAGEEPASSAPIAEIRDHFASFPRAATVTYGLAGIGLVGYLAGFGLRLVSTTQREPRQRGMMRAATILSALVIVLAACGTEAPASKVDSGVRGVVVSGPQCPVETIENPCPDVPVSGIVVRVSLLDGSVETETRTNVEGRFDVAVAPGEYVVQPVVESGGVAFSKPVQVRVSDGRFVEVTLLVDTGIR